MPGPFDYFARIFCVRIWQDETPAKRLVARLRGFGLANVEMLDPDPRVVEPRVRVALAHRTALAIAAANSVQRALVLEDHCLILSSAVEYLDQIASELDRVAWSMLSLGSSPHGRVTELVPGCHHLAQGEFEGSFAVAYTAAAIQQLLARIPGEIPALADWIANQVSYERFIASAPQRLLCVPHLASVQLLLPYEDPRLRERFLP